MALRAYPHVAGLLVEADLVEHGGALRILHGLLDGVAPADEVREGALFGDQDALLVLEVHVRLHGVGGLVEGEGLHADAVGQVAGQAQVHQLRAALRGGRAA